MFYVLKSVYVCISAYVMRAINMHLTGRNRTGPPCSVGRPTTHAPGGRPARPPAALQTTTDDVDRQRQTTNSSERNNTGPLGGPVIKGKLLIYLLTCRDDMGKPYMYFRLLHT